QRLHVRRDDAEVFSDDGHLAEILPEQCEQLAARHLDPVAALGSRVTGRNFPAGGKATEVIYADDVNRSERRAQTIFPPLITAFAVPRPVVDRIAPELAGLAEVIWRHAGNHLRR